MDKYVQECRLVDTSFDKILGDETGCDPAPIMLIRAAARSIVSTCSASRHRELAIADLYRCAGHLKAMLTHGCIQPCRRKGGA